MAKSIISLDIGSKNIKGVVAQTDIENNLKVLGALATASAGVRRGSVIDISETTQSVMNFLEQLERKVDEEIKEVILSVGGTDIKTQKSKGVVAISRANGEVGEDDIARVLEAAQTASMPVNSEIIHAIPKEYKLDDQGSIRNPLNMHGIRLEADVLMVEDSTNHLDNLIKSVEGVKRTVAGVTVGAIVSASSVVDKNQKELGVAVVDIGGDTTSIAVFEEGDLFDVVTVPIGAGHITNDIAIGLRISVDLAERIKLEYGSAFPKEINKREEIDLSEIDTEETEMISRYYVAEIIEARIKEIFEMVNEELKKMGKAKLLPSGVVLVGGGAEMSGVVDIAKSILELPARIGTPNNVSGVLNEVDSPMFSVAVGALSYGKADNDYGEKRAGKYSRLLSNIGVINSDKLDKLKKTTKGWMDKFLP